MRFRLLIVGLVSVSTLLVGHVAQGANTVKVTGTFLGFTFELPKGVYREDSKLGFALSDLRGGYGMGTADMTISASPYAPGESVYAINHPLTFAQAFITANHINATNVRLVKNAKYALVRWDTMNKSLQVQERSGQVDLIFAAYGFYVVESAVPNAKYTEKRTLLDGIIDSFSVWPKTPPAFTMVTYRNAALGLQFSAPHFWTQLYSGSSRAWSFARFYGSGNVSKIGVSSSLPRAYAAEEISAIQSKNVVAFAKIIKKRCLMTVTVKNCVVSRVKSVKIGKYLAMEYELTNNTTAPTFQLHIAKGSTLLQFVATLEDGSIGDFRDFKLVESTIQLW